MNPYDKQIQGNHYKNFKIQPYTFIIENNLNWFQGNCIKYICRYLKKDGIVALDKIIHYCELEKERLRKNGKQQTYIEKYPIAY